MRALAEWSARPPPSSFRAAGLGEEGTRTALGGPLALLSRAPVSCAHYQAPDWARVRAGEAVEEALPASRWESPMAEAAFSPAPGTAVPSCSLPSRPAHLEALRAGLLAGVRLSSAATTSATSTHEGLLLGLGCALLASLVADVVQAPPADGQSAPVAASAAPASEFE